MPPKMLKIVILGESGYVIHLPRIAPPLSFPLPRLIVYQCSTNHVLETNKPRPLFYLIAPMLYRLFFPGSMLT